MGYMYSQISKVEIERTSPAIASLADFTNATNWKSGSTVALSNDFNNYFNYTIYEAGYGPYPELFGNSSLQISSSNTNNVIAALSNFNVSCDESGFQNLTMILKQSQPQTVPSNATLTLYSLGDANYYTYDLSSQTNNASNLNQWTNITIPVGKAASGWSSSGNPTWSNITSLTLSLNYPTTSNVTVNVGGLFFRGNTKPSSN